MPVYLGGDQTVSAFLAMDAPPTHPKNNPIAYLTGEDDYMLIRDYALWLNSTEVLVWTQDYTSLTQLEPAPYAPWPEPEVLRGTDGMQFNPLLKKDEQIWVFVNDLSRCGPFDYSHTDDTYPHLKTLIYVISET